MSFRSTVIQISMSVVTNRQTIEQRNMLILKSDNKLFGR